METKRKTMLSACLLAASAVAASNLTFGEPGKEGYDAVAVALAEIAELQVGSHDWPQWGGWSGRNNTPEGNNIPTTWDIESEENIKWSAKLGSQTYGNPVVANGKVYVGTNNNAGYLKRYPRSVDLGCLLCFDEATGKLIWQHSSEKLPQGRVNDWNLQGICCAPYIDGERGWFVTSRGEVICFDTEGFLDGENDGPYDAEANNNPDEADVVWKYDMMGEMGVFQHNMCSCSVTCAGNILLVNSSNGVDDSHIKLPAPDAPSFFAMNRDSGEVLWTDKSPGNNILHGQWSSPTYSVLGGQPQALFAGGDGWLYSFDPAGDGNGGSKLLWKFDCNPKESKWILGGRGTRNNLIATPVVYDGMVYCAVGQDPEHSEGEGHLWCIDPTKRGDVSPTLAVDKDGKPVAARRLQAIDADAGEKAVPNSNSAVIWHYESHDRNGDGDIVFEEEMHRSCGTVAIKDDILYIADFSGLFHCLNARTGEAYWTHDMLAAAWRSPLIVEGNVYIGDEDGEVSVFAHSKDPKVAMKDDGGEFVPQELLNMGNSVYSSLIVANNVLYVANRSTLYAVTPGGE
jgi:outer membrane protein assembly factor BamB